MPPNLGLGRSIRIQLGTPENEGFCCHCAPPPAAPSSSLCHCGTDLGRRREGGRLRGVPLMNGRRRRITDAMFAHIQMPPPPQRPPQRRYTCPTFAAPSSLRCCPCLSRSEKLLGGLVLDSPTAFLGDSFGVGAVSGESSILLGGKRTPSLSAFASYAMQVSSPASPLSFSLRRASHLS